MEFGKKKLKTPYNPDDLDPEELAELIKDLPLFESLVKAAREEGIRLLLRNPKALPDCKLVLGKTQRTWSNPVKVMQFMRKKGVKEDTYAPRKLVGIGDAAQALKAALGKPMVKVQEMLNGLTVKTKPTLHLAHIDDPRPRYTRGMEFKPIEE